MAKVDDHYDAAAASYHLQYERDLLQDLTKAYPANYFRMHLLINSFLQNNVNRVVEVGTGEGTPLVSLAKSGMDVAGFDISENMVKQTKENFKKYGLDDTKAIWGDIQDPLTYVELLKDGRFDALLAMGVTPHVRNDEFVLNNMKNMVKPGGKLFIEFRNKLFSLFTFNRYTMEFILDDLLKDVRPELKKAVEKDLQGRLAMDKPTPRSRYDDADTPGYDAILSRFHNPFEVLELFQKCGLTECKLLWYHYHPAMPYLESESPALYRDEALKLEHDISNWRGFFLCSAFVVEATVGE